MKNKTLAFIPLASVLLLSPTALLASTVNFAFSGSGITDSNVCPGAANFSAAGFSYDNLYYPSGSPAICSQDYPFSGGVLDIFGVLFNVNSSGTTYTLNLWSNGVVPGAGLLYGVSVAQGSTTINNCPTDSGVAITSFTPIAAPEPGSLFVVVTGLIGLIAFRIRKSGSSTIV